MALDQLLRPYSGSDDGSGTVDGAGPSAGRRMTIRLVALFAVLAAATGPAAAACSGIQQDMKTLQEILQLAILFVGGPAALWGILEWITAGESQERVERGRRRVVRVMAGVAGAVVVVGFINFIKGRMYGSGDVASCEDIGSSSNLVEPAADLAIDAGSRVAMHSLDTASVSLDAAVALV